MPVQQPSRPERSEVERLVDDYLNHCIAKGLTPRTWDKSYGYSLNAVFLPWCRAEGVSMLSALDHRVLDRFTTALHVKRNPKGQPLSKYTVHSYIRPIRQMLNWAEKIGEEKINKARPELPRRELPPREILLPGELEQLEHAVGSERDRLILRVFADTGVRLEELTRLRTQDIVRSGRRAHLHVHGKRDRWRDVPLTPDLLRRLERHVSYLPSNNPSDRLFLAHRRSRSGLYEPLSSNGAYQAIRDAQARAKMAKRVHPHLFRHTWMTDMVRLGMDPIQLSVISGASMPVIRQYYIHLTAEDAYDTMASLWSLRATSSETVAPAPWLGASQRLRAAM